jgi:hypothetical protein
MTCFSFMPGEYNANMHGSCTLLNPGLPASSTKPHAMGSMGSMKGSNSSS